MQVSSAWLSGDPPSIEGRDAKECHHAGETTLLTYQTSEWSHLGLKPRPSLCTTGEPQTMAPM